MIDRRSSHIAVAEPMRALAREAAAKPGRSIGTSVMVGWIQLLRIPENFDLEKQSGTCLLGKIVIHL